MRVVVLLMHGMRAFDITAVLEVFAEDRTGRGVPYDDVVVVSPHAEVVLKHGMRLAARPLTAAAGAELVLVPGSSDLPHLLDALDEAEGRAARHALLDAHAAGATLASLCTGAFLLAATGLLDGAQATTHWSACDLLAERHPRLQVQHNVLHTRDHTGRLWTSAGVSAGIDLCLALHAAAHGAAAAATVARSMVLPAARHGGQAQYVPVRHRPRERAGAEFENLRAAVRDQITRPWSLAELAVAAHVAPRTLQRRFALETGTTPARWVLTERLAAARELLETTHLSVEQIAHRAGFGSADLLRKHFTTHLATSPTRYREAFTPANPSPHPASSQLGGALPRTPPRAVRPAQ